MPLADVQGTRALRKIEKTRWSPVDLVCDGFPDAREPQVLRTKLVRDPHTGAVCVSEAVAFGVLRALGFLLAEPFSVTVSTEFASSITDQYEFAPAIMAGRHWGTVLLTDAFEGEITADHLAQLYDPEEAFLLYLADEVLGHRDRARDDGRARHGNTLLREDDSGHLRLLPIDQSDCFVHPSTICREGALDGAKNGTFAHPLPGIEGILMDRGVRMVDRAFERVADASQLILDSVSEPKDQWYDVAGSDPGALQDFLRYRLSHMNELARRDHWTGIASFGGGGYALLG